jgi:hypothetical protein
LAIASSNARASASVGVDDAVEAVDAGSRVHADISGNPAVVASLAMAARRVNKESDNGAPT